ncbi:MAG: helix-turn-helix transcriptional regulator [Halobacteriota archaeon]
MRLPRGVAVAVVVAAITAAMLASTGAAQEYDDRPTVTVYDADLHEDGNATWAVELRYQLDPGEEEEFERYAESFENNETQVFEGIEREIEPLVREAAEQTGRDTRAVDWQRDVYVEDSLTGEAGVTRVSFTWTEFTDGNQVGDVFEAGGLVLASDQRLVLSYEDGLSIDEVRPEPDTTEDDQLVWEGPMFFEDGQPSVTLGSSSSPSPDVDVTSVAVALGVLVVGLLGGVVLSRSLRRDTTETPSPEEDGESEDVTDDLLTDRDRVVLMLEENGGRMKQADIVDETGWSKSKVSMVLSDMEDEGAVSKLRLGRENVIDLADGDRDD